MTEANRNRLNIIAGSVMRTTDRFKPQAIAMHQRRRAKRAENNALLARPQPDDVRAGLWASRRPARIPSQVRCAAQSSARSLAPPAGARARPIQSRSIWSAAKYEVQPLWRMTCRRSPQRPQGPFVRSNPPTPLAALVTTLACVIEERSSRSAMHSSQRGAPSIRRTRASTRSAIVERPAIRPL